MKLRTRKLAPSMQSNSYLQKAVYARRGYRHLVIHRKYGHRTRALHVRYALKLLDDYGGTRNEEETSGQLRGTKTWLHAAIGAFVAGPSLWQLQIATECRRLSKPSLLALRSSVVNNQGSKLGRSNGEEVAIVEIGKRSECWPSKISGN
jgi:hypothetical protein